MLRSGVKLVRERKRINSLANVFESESATTNDLILMDRGQPAQRGQHKNEPTLPKKNRKKISKQKVMNVEVHSSTKEATGTIAKKKKSKKSRVKEVGAGEGERKVLRGVRRLRRQDNVLDLQQSPSKPKTTSPKSKFTKASPPTNAQWKENVESLTASEHSPTPKKSLKMKSSREYNLVLKEQNDNITDMYDALIPNIDLTSPSPKAKVNATSTPSPPRKLNSTYDKLNNTYDKLNSTYAIIEVDESMNETKKRDPYEIKTQIVTITPEVPSKKRNTYEVDPENSFLLSAKKGSKSQRITEQLPASPATRTRRSLNEPTALQKRKLFSLTLRNEKPKIKISDSKSSLTESGISSASKLLRRAQRMNPHSGLSTPVGTKTKLISPKRSTIKKTSMRPASKVKKVPNYAAIHKNAYEKMESVGDHLQRKNDRAKALLSGNKVPLGTKRPVNDTNAKKQLTYGPAGDAPNTMLQSPKPKRPPIKKSVGFELSTPTRSPHIRHTKTPKPTKEQIWNAYGTKIPTATGNLFTTGTVAPAAKKSTTVASKVQLMKQIKSVSSKSKPSSSSVDTRRNHIKGVRSNRRFDLLMSMRQQMG